MSSRVRWLVSAAGVAATVAAAPVWAEFVASTNVPTAATAVAAPQPPAPVAAAPARPAPPPVVATDPIAQDIASWDRLRRDDYPLIFADYYSFLRTHRGWPGENMLRRRAERAMTATTPLADRLAFFTSFPPLSPIGEFRLAEAYLANGRGAEAMRLARDAWASDGLNAAAETELFARFGPQLTAADHAARVDALLWSGQTSAATRFLPLLSNDVRLLAEARIALRGNSFDAPARLLLVPAALQNDPGLIVERVDWMRRNGDPMGARRLMASTVVAPGAASNPLRWMQARLEMARAAFNDGQYDLAYQIAARHNAYPLGRPLVDHSDSERDVHTDLEFLAGRIAMRQLNRPALAVDHFQNYRAAARAAQTQARGDYWAGRAAEAAGKPLDARRFYMSAGEHPDYFYGQLALERMGKPILLPRTQPPVVSAALRQGFAHNELVRAARWLGSQGDRTRQTQFLRALVDSADTTEQLALIAELAPQLGRPDAGVLAGRAARGTGELSLIDAAYPRLPVDADERWTMIHAITRQESRFDRAAVSSANARGLMQLMPGTAREQAGKMGLPYDMNRLTTDETYNVTLGSAYYQRLVDRWGGNHMLAVASYNAGAGNVNKWVNANGDPRNPGVDTIEWIEAIPFNETRNYVQRVLENAVVYDQLHPRRSGMQAAMTTPLSNYLGKRQPG